MDNENDEEGYSDDEMFDDKDGENLKEDTIKTEKIE